MHAEAGYGEDVTRDAGALAFPNTAVLFPFPGKRETTISGLFVLQTLSESFVLTAGKYRTLDV